MPTRTQRDFKFLRGFIEAIKVVSRREALGDEGFHSLSPGQYAQKLVENGFARQHEQSISATDLNRLAQYFYEEAQNSEGIRILMPMTGKEELVNALRMALARIDVRTHEDGVQ